MRPSISDTRLSCFYTQYGFICLSANEIGHIRRPRPMCVGAGASPLNRIQRHGESLTRGQETRVGVRCHVSRDQSTNTTFNGRRNYSIEQTTHIHRQVAPSRSSIWRPLIRRSCWRAGKTSCPHRRHRPQMAGTLMVAAKNWWVFHCA